MWEFLDDHFGAILTSVVVLVLASMAHGLAREYLWRRYRPPKGGRVVYSCRRHEHTSQAEADECDRMAGSEHDEQ